MHFAGIDIASATHVIAIVDSDSAVVLKATPFAEDALGYEKLLGLLGASSDLLIAMEATGHYWKNLFATLAAAGYRVALLNPLRTHRFASEELARTKTDAIDALGLARFAAQKRPAPAGGGQWDHRKQHCRDQRAERAAGPGDRQDQHEEADHDRRHDEQPLRARDGHRHAVVEGEVTDPVFQPAKQLLRCQGGRSVQGHGGVPSGCRCGHFSSARQ
ncbi:MAG: transposase [Burkholderiales bacterium]|nr:transposase [Burkholderiales bacterium]